MENVLFLTNFILIKNKTRDNKKKLRTSKSTDWEGKMQFFSVFF